MNVGVVFASTGGNKLVRSIRSLRKTEPNILIHVVLDVMSGTWRQSNDSVKVLDWLEVQPNVLVDFYEDNTNHWINGTLNACMRFIKAQGYSHACMFHDDLVFSPLPENWKHVSGWFMLMEEDERLREASGISFSLMESFYPGPGSVEGHEGIWHRAPAEWDTMDLESVDIWDKLLPDGRTVGYFGEDGIPVGRVQLDGWFVHCYCASDIRKFTRLGPTGSIVPIKTWEEVGGFDEKEGLVYDMEYPVRCVLKGLPPVYVIPNTPHLHLHNQSIAFADPAVGTWGNCLQSFINHYGKEPGQIWAELGYPKY